MLIHEMLILTDIIFVIQIVVFIDCLMENIILIQKQNHHHMQNMLLQVLV